MRTLLPVVVMAAVGALGCGEPDPVGQRQNGGVHAARCGRSDGPAIAFGLDTAPEALDCRKDDATARTSLTVFLNRSLSLGSFAAVGGAANAEADARFHPPGGGGEILLSGTFTIDAIEGPVVTGHYELGQFPGEGVRRGTFESNRCEDSGSTFAYERCGSPYLH
jgi:hypothetical protein